MLWRDLARTIADSSDPRIACRYDKSALGDIEKALFESDVGMTPNSDGKVIRLNVPQLTTERRAELAKTAKALGEEGKVCPTSAQPLVVCRPIFNPCTHVA